MHCALLLPSHRKPEGRQPPGPALRDDQGLCRPVPCPNCSLLVPQLLYPAPTSERKRWGPSYLDHHLASGHPIALPSKLIGQKRAMCIPQPLKMVTSRKLANHHACGYSQDCGTSQYSGHLASTQGQSRRCGWLPPCTGSGQIPAALWASMSLYGRWPGRGHLLQLSELTKYLRQPLVTHRDDQMTFTWPFGVDLTVDSRSKKSSETKRPGGM